MNKICVITAARSEYGLLRWVIDEIHRDPGLELQLVVTGAHLNDEQGKTVRFIEEDGYPIAAKVDMHLAPDSPAAIIGSMGYCSIGMADAFTKLQPDLVVVLGDRYELLSIVGAALVARIPVAHISGGDVTEGAIDNEIRNAVSMMSTLHFPGVEPSAARLRRMLDDDRRVFTVGEPGLESFLRFDLLNRQELSEALGLDTRLKWCLVTLHPETKISIEENLEMARNLFEAMCVTDGVQYVISRANADFGGKQINAFWEQAVSGDPDRFKLFSSLGQQRYLSFMHEAAGVLGNSSSGIVEAPFLGIPVLNVGDRQKGRHLCRNVIQCGRGFEEIRQSLDELLKRPKVVDTYYGDGRTASKIVGHIKTYLNETQSDRRGV